MSNGFTFGAQSAAFFYVGQSPLPSSVYEQHKNGSRILKFCDRHQHEKLQSHDLLHAGYDENVIHSGITTMFDSMPSLTKCNHLWESELSVLRDECKMEKYIVVIDANPITVWLFDLFPVPFSLSLRTSMYSVSDYLSLFQTEKGVKHSLGRLLPLNYRQALQSKLDAFEKSLGCKPYKKHKSSSTTKPNGTTTVNTQSNGSSTSTTGWSWGGSNGFNGSNGLKSNGANGSELKSQSENESDSDSNSSTPPPPVQIQWSWPETKTPKKEEQKASSKVFSTTTTTTSSSSAKLKTVTSSGIVDSDSAEDKDPSFDSSESSPEPSFAPIPKEQKKSVKPSNPSKSTKSSDSKKKTVKTSKSSKTVTSSTTNHKNKGDMSKEEKLKMYAAKDLAEMVEDRKHAPSDDGNSLLVFSGFDYYAIETMRQFIHVAQYIETLWYVYHVMNTFVILLFELFELFDFSLIEIDIIVYLLTCSLLISPIHIPY